ncbi:hypothetical protein LSH36_472g01066 [Paralvinella palmiformis]|uniref:Uncharacterized protein n=1 Tax=Paralvinella palmiformis TaxID=53620 RepID=A0AAD9JA01_9ANNE|nr:hypothetical protein LSH36_472g01066 [Paralvinella palmiformis]
MTKEPSLGSFLKPEVMPASSTSRLRDQRYSDAMTLAHFVRSWDNYVLLFTLVVITSMIFQIQLLASYPQERYPLNSKEYSERIVVDEYVRQEMVALGDEGDGYDIIHRRRTLSPFERLLRRRKLRDQQENDDNQDDSDSSDDSQLPVCERPPYTTFSKCRIEIVARPAPPDDVPEEDVMDGPWRGYIAVDRKEVYKWKMPPTFIVFG